MSAPAISTTLGSIGSFILAGRPFLMKERRLGVGGRDFSPISVLPGVEGEIEDWSFRSREICAEGLGKEISGLRFFLLLLLRNNRNPRERRSNNPAMLQPTPMPICAV